jgi:hypothetical protein
MGIMVKRLREEGKRKDRKWREGEGEGEWEISVETGEILLPGGGKEL